MAAKTMVQKTTITTVETKVKILTDKDDPEKWSLEVNIDWQGLKFHLTVDEPYLSSYEKWTNLIQGKNRTILGGGNSHIFSNSEKLDVNAESSGVGGNMVIGVSIPRDSIATSLQEAIDYAHECGMKFAAPAPTVYLTSSEYWSGIDPRIGEAHRQWVEETKSGSVMKEGAAPSE